MVRLRAFGMYSYHVSNPVAFMSKLSGTREIYRADDLEPHLRNLVVSRMAEAFAKSQVPFLDMAASTATLATTIAKELQPGFEELGLALDSFTVESLSLPDELQKRLDERIGMNMVGNLGQYAQFQAAQAIPIAAANEGGAAGAGVGLGAGLAMGQAMGNAIAGATGGGGAAGAAGAAAALPKGETRFCSNCGASIPRTSKFCAECGEKQP
jgi:membrane protease subunit (stomatin/prohibitin family)